MKTINIGSSAKGKSVKKLLVNRSRSGNLASFMSRIDQSRSNVSPYRNSIGLQNYQETGSKNQAQSKFTLNEDYYEIQKQPQRKRKFQKKERKVTKQINVYDSKEIAQKQKETNRKSDRYDCTAQNTTESSKVTGQHASKIKYINSEYMRSEYLSPSVQLEKLERERVDQKQNSCKYLKKVLKIQQDIKQSRNRYSLQAQLYQQIISNLKKQSKLTKSSLYLQSKLSRQLKHSGSMETEQGQSSNEY